MSKLTHHWEDFQLCKKKPFWWNFTFQKYLTNSALTNDLLCASLPRIHLNNPWQIKAYRSVKGVLGVVERRDKVRGGRTWRWWGAFSCLHRQPGPARLCCPCFIVTCELRSYNWEQHCLTRSMRWKWSCVAWLSSFHRKVSHTNICLQGKSFRSLLLLTDLNVFTGESMPKEFLSSDQMLLFHPETFQFFHPYSTLLHIFHFLSCL